MKPPAGRYARIDALVSFAADQRLRWNLPGDSGLTVDGCSLILSARSKAGRVAIAQILLEQYAYGLSAQLGAQAVLVCEAFGAAETYQPSLFPSGIVDPVAAVQAAVEFEADACACDSWDMSLAAWLIAGIMSRAARMLAAEQERQTERRAGDEVRVVVL